MLFRLNHRVRGVTTDPHTYPYGTLPQRLWANLNMSDPDGCWEWLGARLPKGYGFIQGTRWRGEDIPYRPLRAHRVAYELAVGLIPDGMYVLHRCDNPPCCNPAHLFVGTAKDNARDMVAKGRCRNQWTGSMEAAC